MTDDTPAARQARYEARLREAGYHRLRIWVPSDAVGWVEAVAAELRAAAEAGQPPVIPPYRAAALRVKRQGRRA